MGRHINHHKSSRNFTIAHAGLLAGVALADTPKVQSLDNALRRLDGRDKAGSVKSTSAWKMGSVFEHLAQRINMSLDGFP